MKYAVKFPSTSIEKKFLKFLSGISVRNLQDRIMRETLFLGDNPRPCGEPKIKPPLDVYNYAAQYRLRVGSYRILYDVDDRKKTVWILAIRKRNERTY